MSDVDLVFAELVSANPVPAEAVPHHMALNEEEVLEVIERWIAAEGVSTAAAPAPAPYARAWIAAAAAFAVVLVFVGVIAAVTLTREGDAVEPPSTATSVTTSTPPTSSPPPTTPAPTTTTATSTTSTPEVPPNVRAAIDDFVAIFNAGDPLATMAALSPDADVWTSLIAGTFTSEDPLPLAEFEPVIERWLRFLTVQRTAITVDSCRYVDGERINCSGTFTDEVVEASPLPPASLSITFTVSEEGAVSLLFVRENKAAVDAAYGYFNLWLDENYPGEDVILYDGTGRPSFLDKPLALWETRVAEWIQSLDG